MKRKDKATKGKLYRENGLIIYPSNLLFKGDIPLVIKVAHILYPYYYKIDSDIPLYKNCSHISLP
ncbi:hypothetical protein, partial [Prevotella lacticifex]|uniref:hypothetical protein n=1 Tax=Prevotella lacticifex TaxID=2854755 RepID=UPI001CC3E74E